MKLPWRDPARPHQDPNQLPDAPARTLSLGPHEELDEPGLERPDPARVRARVRLKTLQAIAPVGVEPALDGPRRQPQPPPRGMLVEPLSGLLKQPATIAVLQARADQRAQHRVPSQRDLASFVVVHERVLPRITGHFGWDRHELFVGADTVRVT